MASPQTVVRKPSALARWVLLLLACLVAIAAAVVAAVLVLGRVPLIEGDHVITAGSAYGFTIGMTKAEAARVLRQRYAHRGANVRVVWAKRTPIDSRLARYENTEFAEYLAREHGEHRIAASDVSHQSQPFALCAEWRVELPATWVNSIYLTFANDRLTQIQRSRWLSERP